MGIGSEGGGEVLDIGYLECDDTCCYGGGCLTALDVETGKVWQANGRGVPLTL